MEQFCMKHHITATATPVVASNPWMLDAAMRHWKVRLRMPDGPQGYGVKFQVRHLTVLFSQGSAQCLVTEGVDNARDFDDWCLDLGFDPDSRKAEKTFKACQSIARKLKQFLGSAYEEAGTVQS